MKLPMMPRNIERVEANQKFAFSCHKKLNCFTHCCRMLELALTPYDVLRLKSATNLHSRKFLDRYVIIEQEADDIFPRYYLTMVDDGNGSCVFVTPGGCTVYQDRPAACRTYPMGRGAMRNENNQIEDIYVLLKEDHCQGFEEQNEQTPLEYTQDQGLDIYNRINDALIVIQQHDDLRSGRKLTQTEARLYTLALYDLDTFREKLFSNDLPVATQVTDAMRHELRDDEKLLLFAIDWLADTLFTTTVQR